MPSRVGTAELSSMYSKGKPILSSKQGTNSLGQSSKGDGFVKEFSFADSAPKAGLDLKNKINENKDY